MNVVHDMGWSHWAFMNLVWPLIASTCGNGRIVPVENDNGESEVCRILDRYGGIDYLQLRDNDDGTKTVHGIASRVQKIDLSRGRPYNTFTIRRSVPSGRATEIHKRRAAAVSSRVPVQPYLTVQAYVDLQVQSVLSIGVATTQNVLAAAREDCINVARDGGNTFYVVPFDTVLGVEVWPIEHKQTA